MEVGLNGGGVCQFSRARVCVLWSSGKFRT
jgi:hypothetical protein